MLHVLYEVENRLPALLASREGWNGLYIDYHEPFVERVWRDWGKYRINLHRIKSCIDGEALYHPHPWPSTMRIVSGEYEMGIGYSQDDTAPKTAAKLILPSGTAYEMIEPNGWHFVRPLTQNTLSVMVTGEPWKRKASKPIKQLQPLDASTITELLDIFQPYYS